MRRCSRPSASDNAYPQIAGQSGSRLEAISDGVFAVAVAATLLVLDFAVQGKNVAHSQRPLWTPGSLGAERPVLHELSLLAPKVPS